MTFQRSRDQDVARHTPKRVVRHDVTTCEALHTACSRHMRQQGGDVQAGVAVQRAPVVLHGDHLAACLSEQLGGYAPNVAKPLYCHASVANVQTNVPRGFAAHRENPSAGGLLAAQ